MNAILWCTISVLLTILHHHVAAANAQSSLPILRRQVQSLVKVTALQLFDTTTNAKVADIVNGTVVFVPRSISGSSLLSYNIRAILSDSVWSRSVLFNSKSAGLARTNNFAPYDQCIGVTATSSSCPRFGYGTHDITVQPYQYIFRLGIKGIPMTVTFTIAENRIPAPTQVPVNVPTTVQSPTRPNPIIPKVPVQPPVQTKVTLSPQKAPLVPIPPPRPPPSPRNAPVSVPTKMKATSSPTKAPTKALTTAAPVPNISGDTIRLELIQTDIIPNKVVTVLKWNTVNLIDLRKLDLSNDVTFNINAVVVAVPGNNSSTNSVQSVLFSNNRVESNPPFAYCGNVGTLFNTCNDLSVGATLNITVTGYSAISLQGTPYPMQWAGITIASGVTSPVAVSVPSRSPATAPIPTPTTVVVPTAPRSCILPQITSNTWWSTPPAPYPITVAEAQGSMIGNDFVIFSGFKNGYSMATTETYALDLSVPNSQWRRMDDMPFPAGITHLGIAVSGRKAYLCGGYVGGSLGPHTNVCFIYDHSKPVGTGAQWTSFDPLPDGGRSGGGMIYDTATNTLVYAAGSKRPIPFQHSAIDYFDTWIFSLNNPSIGWVSKTNIPFTGNHMNFVTANDSTGKEHHYFFGGQLGENEERGNTATMYEYIVSTDTWIQRKSMPFPRGHSAAASRAVNCGFIVAGGRTNSGLTDEITFYDIGSDTWTAIGTLPVQIHTNVCVIYRGMLRCETGWAEGTFSSERPLKLE